MVVQAIAVFEAIKMFKHAINFLFAIIMLMVLNFFFPTIQMLLIAIALFGLGLTLIDKQIYKDATISWGSIFLVAATLLLVLFLFNVNLQDFTGSMVGTVSIIAPGSFLDDIAIGFGFEGGLEPITLLVISFSTIALTGFWYEAVTGKKLLKLKGGKAK